MKDSLLRNTNRGMDQQRVIEKMKAERRETICVQAQQRQELEKDLHSAETKVGCGVWLSRSFACSWVLKDIRGSSSVAREVGVRQVDTGQINTVKKVRS